MTQILASVESFEEAYRFYQAAEAVLVLSAPDAASDVFLKQALCLLHLQRCEEAVQYAANALRLKQQQECEDDDDLVLCLDQCAAVFVSCGRVGDVGVSVCCDVVHAVHRGRDRAAAGQEEDGAREGGDARVAGGVGGRDEPAGAGRVACRRVWQITAQSFLEKMRLGGGCDETVAEAMGKAPKMLAYLDGLLESLGNPVSAPSAAKRLHHLIVFAKGESFVV